MMNVAELLHTIGRHYPQETTAFSAGKLTVRAYASDTVQIAVGDTIIPMDFYVSEGVIVDVLKEHLEDLEANVVQVLKDLEAEC